MRQSEMVFKTRKEPPKSEVAENAKLLIRAGFIEKLMAGVYTFLPFGLRVLNKIEDIVREEMNAIRGQELLMPALHPKEEWEKSGRWESFDVLFKLKSRFGPEHALGPTHEEVLYPLLTQYIESYRDLPTYLYQIQTKFRDEPRAKSGLLRGHEFRMKDLYSFHIDDKDRDGYYGEVRKAYIKIFKRLGLAAVETRASGGTFSELSHEFQVICSVGEDEIVLCKLCGFAENAEIKKHKKGLRCPQCESGVLEQARSIEVGNIFPLKEKFARDFNLTFKGKNGEEKLVSVGCYGLGTSRAMGAIVEVHHDEEGMIWPEAVAPFRVHLLAVGEMTSVLKKQADQAYNKLAKAEVEVLYDDRREVAAGEKFFDADLIGLPVRLVVSGKTMVQGKLEVKRRDKKETKLMKMDEVMRFVQVSKPKA